MNKKFTRYAVIILAILLAELLHSYIHSFLYNYLQGSSPYISVIISMIVTVLIFYPAFLFIKRYFKPSEKYIEGTKKIKKRFFGLMIGFLMALFLLFAAFSQVWYHKNPLLDFQEWIKGIL